MAIFASNPLAEAYIAEGRKAEMPERQRYCLDIARELYFLQVRNLLYDRLASSRYMTAERGHAHRRLEPNPTDGGYNLGDSLLYWKLAKSIELFTGHYGAGEFAVALRDLPTIAQDSKWFPNVRWPHPNVAATLPGWRKLVGVEPTAAR
ncbi:MAG: hypothetical protein ABFD60_00805 [Bryobacteraceae bacterium]